MIITKQKTKEVKVQESGDYTKQMILTVDASKHSWIKNISEQTGITQPNVVNLILSEAIKNDAADYINQIKKAKAKSELQKLEEEAHRIESERKRLTELLKS